MRSMLLLCALLPAAATLADTTTELPRGVRPTEYALTLTPDAKALRFHGDETVTIEVAAPTRSITLNGIHLTVEHAALTPITGGASTPLEATVDAQHETLTLAAAKPIARGSYRLAIAYDGVIETQAVGLFALDYASARGKERALYTQFESSDARRVFPSFDEPQFRTPYSLDVIAPAGQMVVSNMPAATTTTLPDGRVRTHFPPTPPMSSYLLFFGVGDFERATAMAGKTEVGVVARRGAIDQAGFALEAQKEILAEYNDYFGTPFPLPKLDNVAAPGSSQFFGAMENWGAIFTFESILLADPSIATARDRQSIFDVDAHEMAHQWFGDLVTMRWWDDLWLNEGFASWMQGRTTEKLHPEWESSLDAVGVRSGAMATDALATTHPIVQHLKTAAEAGEAFDSITYSKGESVLRMLEAYVGSDVWREGIRAYMKAHAYSNTTSDDLWHAIDGVSKTPITEIAHAFTLTPGVPQVNVSAGACVGGETPVTLTQSEFRVGPHTTKPAHWPIPVTVGVVGGTQTRLVLKDARLVTRVAGCGPVMANPGQRGYYRVRYDEAAFATLLAAYPKLPAIDQIGLLDDSFALARVGDLPMGAVFDLLAATPADANAQVWREVVSIVSRTEHYYARNDAGLAPFHARMRALLAPIYARVGFVPAASEDVPVKLLRERLLDTLAACEDPTVKAEALRRYRGAAVDPTLVPSEMRKDLIGLVAYDADEPTWEQLRATAQTTASPVMRDYLYTSLGATHSPALAQKALELALSDEPGATTSASIIGAVSYRHPELAFNFAVAHLDAVLSKVDASSARRYIARLGAGSSDPATEGRIRAFTAAHLADGPHRDADAAALSTSIAATIRTTRLPQLDAWVKAHP